MLLIFIPIKKPPKRSPLHGDSLSLIIPKHKQKNHKVFKQKTSSQNVTLPTKSIKTAAVDDGAITPVQRSGGFATGTINLATSGNKVVSGLGFSPKMIQFTYFPGASATTASTGSGLLMADGTQWSTAANRDTAGNQVRNSVDTACLITLSGASTTPITTLEYVSIDSDGFTVNNTGTSANSAKWTAFG